MNAHVHIASGMAVGSAILFFEPEIIQVDQNIFLLISCGLSVLPDINLLWSPTKKHHKDLTHYPLFWLPILLLISIIEFYFINSGIWTLFIFLNIFIHLFLDTFGWTIGIHWFWPFSDKEYSFTKLEKDKIDISNFQRFKKIFSHKLTLLEMLIFIMFLAVSYFLY